MSTQQSLPPVWVDRLFQRFTQVWGTQKVSAHFAPPDGQVTDWMEDVHNLWSAQLAPFSGPVIGRALQAAIDEGREWPPTLPEFRALCRQFNRPEHSAAALPAPGQGSTDREAGRAQIERIKAMMTGAVKVMP